MYVATHILVLPVATYLRTISKKIGLIATYVRTHVYASSRSAVNCFDSSTAIPAPGQPSLAVDTDRDEGNNQRDEDANNNSRKDAASQPSSPANEDRSNRRTY